MVYYENQWKKLEFFHEFHAKASFEIHERVSKTVFPIYSLPNSIPLKFYSLHILITSAWKKGETPSLLNSIVCGKKKNTYKKQFFETFLKSPLIFIEKRIVLHFRMWLYFQIPTSMKIQDYYFLEIRHLLLKKEKKILLWDENKKTIFFFV